MSPKTMPRAARVSAAVELLPALVALAKRAATYSRTAQKANRRFLPEAVVELQLQRLAGPGIGLQGHDGRRGDGLLLQVHVGAAGDGDEQCDGRPAHPQRPAVAGEDLGALGAAARRIFAAVRGGGAGGLGAGKRLGGGDLLPQRL